MHKLPVTQSVGHNHLIIYFFTIEVKKKQNEFHDMEACFLSQKILLPIPLQFQYYI